MALLATQDVPFTGVTPSLAAAASTDTFTPDRNLWLYISNSGASTTVTVTTPGTYRGLAIADLSVVVASGSRFIKISPADLFADPSTGLGTISYTSTASVTVGIFQIQDR